MGRDAEAVLFREDGDLFGFGFGGAFDFPEGAGSALLSTLDDSWLSRSGGLLNRREAAI